MLTKRKKVIKRIVVLLIVGVAIVSSLILYLFNMPHRDVQSLNANYILTSSQIVNEYLSDKDAANAKYLSALGESKILEITGVVHKISQDFNDQTVLLLKDNDDKAGVSATLISNTIIPTSHIKLGDLITVKGVIRSGASFDEDLGMYENVILDKCDIIIK